MKKIFYIMLLILISTLFSGCSVSKQVVGEYYLEGKKFDKGYEYFKNKVEENPQDASSNYYFGRFLLIKKRDKEALQYLEKAVSLDNKNSKYYSWLGVAYSNLKMPKKENSAYLSALKYNKKNLQALTYLAHNYFESKQYKKALEFYGKVLKEDSLNQYALYNRALSLKNLKRYPEEVLAWKIYLDNYPAGKLANKAVQNLNSYGVFTYRNHIIGVNTITLKKIEFEPFSSELDFDSTSSLDVLGKILTKKEEIKIYIVVYQQNNKQLAKKRAQNIKKYILKKYSKIDTERLVLAWFDKSKKIKAKKRVFVEGEVVDFITIVEQK